MSSRIFVVNNQIITTLLYSAYLVGLSTISVTQFYYNFFSKTAQRMQINVLHLLLVDNPPSELLKALISIY